MTRVGKAGVVSGSFCPIFNEKLYLESVREQTTQTICTSALPIIRVPSNFQNSFRITCIIGSTRKKNIIRLIRPGRVALTCIFVVFAINCVAVSPPMAQFPLTASTFLHGFAWRKRFQHSGVVSASPGIMPGTGQCCDSCCIVLVRIDKMRR